MIDTLQLKSKKNIITIKKHIQEKLLLNKLSDDNSDLLIECANWTNKFYIADPKYHTLYFGYIRNYQNHRRISDSTINDTYDTMNGLLHKYHMYYDKKHCRIK